MQSKESPLKRMKQRLSRERINFVKIVSDACTIFYVNTRLRVREFAEKTTQDPKQVLESYFWILWIGLAETFDAQVRETPEIDREPGQFLGRYDPYSTNWSLPPGIFDYDEYKWQALKAPIVTHEKGLTQKEWPLLDTQWNLERTRRGFFSDLMEKCMNFYVRMAPQIQQYADRAGKKMERERARKKALITYFYPVWKRLMRLFVKQQNEEGNFIPYAWDDLKPET